MIRQAILFLLIFFSSGLLGQNEYQQVYLSQDSLINKAMKNEDYKLATTLIGQQLLFIKSYNLYDSLYHYCYNYGRAVWKIKGIQEGLSEAKRISDEVKEKDSDPLHFLQTLNDLSWLYYETGNVKLCLENDSVYLAICLSIKNVPAETLSLAYYNLGFDLVELGNYSKALELFQHSVDVILNSNDSLTKELSKSYNALGAMQWRIGDLENAKTSYKSSLKLVKQFDDPISMLEQGNILGNMALLSQDNGEIIKAKELQEQFLNIDQKAMPYIEDVSWKETAIRRMSSAYINLADIYFSLGEYSKARKLVELAIEERKKVVEPDDPSLASAIEHLAYLELQSGNLVVAEKELTDYLNYCQKYYGEKSAFTAWAYKEMGNLYLEKKQYKKSEAYFNKAIKSQQLVGNSCCDPALGLIYRERSALFAGMNNHKQANADLEKSLQIYRNTRDKDNSVFISLYLEIAESKLDIGDVKGAEVNVEKAFNLIPDQNETKKLSPHLLPKAYYLKALTGIKKDSSLSSVINALHNLEKSIDYLKVHKQIYLDEESKLMLYAAHEMTFELAEKLAFTLYETTGEELWLEKLFTLTEENKTILLRSRLQNFSSLDYAGVPDSILARERQLESKLRNENNDPEATKDIVNTEHKFNQLKEYLEVHYPEYYSLKYRDKSFSIDDVQEELLNDSISLLVYSVTKENIYALIINKNNARGFKLPKGDLSEEIQSLNDALVQGNEKAFSKYSSLLYQKLVAPIKPFPVARQIIIVPDKELFFLNFEILQKQNDEKPYDYGSMLISDYVISYYLSTNVAMQFRQLDHIKPTKLMTFAPGFSDSQKAAYEQSLSDTSRLDKKFLSFIRQPFVVNSAIQIAGLYSGKSFIEDDADETTFKKEAGKYGIIHLGTHAEINQQSPLMSHLVMSKNINNDSVDDGYLNAYEIYQMPLRAELAVLTACETGLGKQLNSEGIVSLAHSFSYAGCPSIVMTLWNVDEKSSSEIISNFYKYLSRGMPKNKALRQAKLDFLMHCPEELKSPYYWAGMVLLGDQSPVNIKTEFNWFRVISVVAVVLILLILLFKRKKRPL